jgi:hypothetical protein
MMEELKLNVEWLQVGKTVRAWLRRTVAGKQVEADPVLPRQLDSSLVGLARERPPKHFLPFHQINIMAFVSHVPVTC